MTLHCSCRGKKHKRYDVGNEIKESKGNSRWRICVAKDEDEHDRGDRRVLEHLEGSRVRGVGSGGADL
jgi:hypothetical protein